jgi:hypothetical protein
LALLPFKRPVWRVVRQQWSAPDSLWPLLAAWAAVTLVVPTVMQTKVAWYLNTFYPLFAIGVALVVARAFAVFAPQPLHWRSVTLIATVVIAFGIAEGKMLWYSWTRRDISLSEQSLLVEERSRLKGQRVYLEPDSSRATRFVTEVLAGATPASMADDGAFFRESQGGDYRLSSVSCGRLHLEKVRSSRHQFLCRRPLERRMSDLIMDMP